MKEKEILDELEKQTKIMKMQTRILVEIAEMVRTSNDPYPPSRDADLRSSLNLVKSIARDEIY